MTKDQFDKYGFGVNTRCCWDDEWYKVMGVDFEDRTILLTNIWVGIDDIDDIREDSK